MITDEEIRKGYAKMWNKPMSDADLEAFKQLLWCARIPPEGSYQELHDKLGEHFDDFSKFLVLADRLDQFPE